MGFETNFIVNNQKKSETIKISEEDKKEAFLTGMGKGAREEQLERKPDGFERVHKVHKSKKQYNRKDKHKDNY